MIDFISNDLYYSSISSMMYTLLLSGHKVAAKTEQMVTYGMETFQVILYCRHYVLMKCICLNLTTQMLM